MENELCNILIKSAKKELAKWQKKYPKTPLLNLVQQINLAAIELNKMANREEELYKNNLVGRQYYDNP